MRYTASKGGKYDIEVLDDLDGKYENGPVRVMHENEFYDMLTYERAGGAAWR